MKKAIRQSILLTHAWRQSFIRAYRQTLQPTVHWNTATSSTWTKRQKICQITFSNNFHHHHHHHHLSLILDGQGKARREAARRRNSECKINLSCRNSSRGNGSKPTAQRWLAGSAALRPMWPSIDGHINEVDEVDDPSTLPAYHRCAVGLLSLLREESGLLKLILHSELRRRAASRRALPCPSS